MIEFEKRGLPTVSFTAQGFIHDSARSAQNFGLPFVATAVMQAPFTGQSPETVRAMVDGCVGQVIDGLTREPAGESAGSEITLVDEEWLSFEGDDLLEAEEVMNARYLEFGWSDGFPLRPATERQVERMLAGTSRAAEEVVAVLEPGFGMATVRKIAANAVMAGCRPEHLPVVITAVECIADPRIYLRNKAMSTGPHAPLIVVNGPIRNRIGLNSGVCALGPGSPSFANTVIGRALRLCMMNLGHTYPGVSDMDTVGSPTKYSMCVAENEESSPWSPYHVDRGCDAGSSAVTVHFTYGICELRDFQNFLPSPLIEIFSSAATNLAQVSTGMWLLGRRADPRYGTEEKEHHFMLICPEHARIFREAGWGREDIKREMHRRARAAFRSLMLNKEPRSMSTAHPELNWLWDSPDTMLPVLEDADCYEIAVVGGAGSSARGAFFYGAGGPVTKVIRE